MVEVKVKDKATTDYERVLNRRFYSDSKNLSFSIQNKANILNKNAGSSSLCVLVDDQVCFGLSM